MSVVKNDSSPDLTRRTHYHRRMNELLTSIRANYEHMHVWDAITRKNSRASVYKYPKSNTVSKINNIKIMFIKCWGSLLSQRIQCKEGDAEPEAGPTVPETSSTWRDKTAAAQENGEQTAKTKMIKHNTFAPSFSIWAKPGALGTCRAIFVVSVLYSKIPPPRVLGRKNQRPVHELKIQRRQTSSIDSRTDRFTRQSDESQNDCGSITSTPVLYCDCAAITHQINL